MVFGADSEGRRVRRLLRELEQAPLSRRVGLELTWQKCISFLESIYVLRIARVHYFDSLFDPRGYSPGTWQITHSDVCCQPHDSQLAVFAGRADSPPRASHNVIQRLMPDPPRVAPSGLSLHLTRIHLLA